MNATLKISRPRKWTWSGARFVREKSGEVKPENQKRSQRNKRARFYAAQLGRFISRDPLGFTDGFNLYRAYFVPGGVDPRGLDVVVFPIGDDRTEKIECTPTMILFGLCPDDPPFVPTDPIEEPIIVGIDVFYCVRSTPTDVAIADKCGCQHVDVYSTLKGEIYTGAGGSTDIEHAPKFPTTCDPSKGDILLEQNDSGTLQYGDHNGESCRFVTAQQIDNCFQNFPTLPPEDYRELTNNCRWDVTNAIKACCLKGF